MGPLRRTESCTLYGYAPNMQTSNQISRNLSKSQLGGVIFGCTKNTMRECLTNQLFGLPFQHISYVQNINPGLPLFLFNYSDQKLHGIFEAASPGQLNINPYGWTTDGDHRTPFPAQVQVCLRLQCQPLAEEQFRPVIADNYYNPRHFWFELDHTQANKLMCILTSLAVAPSLPLPGHVRTERKIFQLPLTETKMNTESTSSCALDADHDAQSNLALGYKDPDSASYGVKEDLEDLLTMKVMISSDSSCKLGSIDGDSKVDGGKQLLKSHSDSTIAEQYEKDIVISKLKELKLHMEKEDLSSSVGDSSSTIDKIIDSQDVVDEQTGRDGKIEKSSNASFIDLAIISQLMMEMEELKSFRTEQSSKIAYLEQKLVEAEAEIWILKERCSSLESELNPSTERLNETMIALEDETPFDPSESILLLGGYDGESWLSRLDAYFPSQDVIKCYKPMSCNRSFASVAKLNGQIYILGGYDGGSLWYDTVESYSPSNDEWTHCSSLNVKKGNLGGVALHDKIFAIGGGNGNDIFSDVEMLDLDVGRWMRTRSMLEKRFGLAAAELHGSIYATGGFDGNEYLKSAERFDPREHSWRKIAAMNSRRGCHSLVVLNEILYAMGGYDGKIMVSSAEMYDPRKEAWVSVDSMHNARGYSAAAVLHDSIYVMGGTTIKQGILNNVEFFKEGRGWQNLSTQVIGKRCYFFAITI